MKMLNEIKFFKNIDLKDDELISIDLSKLNKDLSMFDTTSSQEWERYIDTYLNKYNAKVAYGGYLEERNLYDRSDYFQSTSINEKRNIHLGVDFWCKANTPICSLFEGKIHSFKNNRNYGDYGPTIILEHQINKVKFYTLYGHLSLESIQGKSIGQEIEKGEVFCFLGESKVNGDYAPHLHFQIIFDLHDNYGDYPGVCSKKDLNFYKENCPDLKTLLKVIKE